MIDVPPPAAIFAAFTVLLLPTHCHKAGVGAPAPRDEARLRIQPAAEAATPPRGSGLRNSHEFRYVFFPALPVAKVVRPSDDQPAAEAATPTGGSGLFETLTSFATFSFPAIPVAKVVRPSDDQPAAEAATPTRGSGLRNSHEFRYVFTHKWGIPMPFQ